MFQKLSLTALLIGSANGLDFQLRSSFQKEEAGQYSCVIAGAAGEDACISSKSDDGSPCEWCQIAGYGACLSKDQADQIENLIPGVQCDGSGGGDDDDAVSTDDDHTPPDDYWKCLTDYKDEDACSNGGCTWCDTKGGYGICLSDEAAENADGSEWFTCKKTLQFTDEMLKMMHVKAKDPYDTSCLIASLQQDEDACKTTVDEDGQACEWCAVSGVQLCITSEQAEIAEQVGGSCDATVVADSETELKDPYDTSCLIASLEQDESICKNTFDSDGGKCDWCSMNGVDLCLNGEQAEIVDQIGGSCDTSQIKEAKDPYDTSCLVASLEQDEDACKATTDEDGQACEWCAVSGVQLCITSEQAEIAEQVGGSCDAAVVAESETELKDPYDTSCLLASLEQDESVCEGTVDSDGGKCDWCNINGVDLCLNDEQAEIVDQIGGSCDNRQIKEMKDPYDTSCLIASLEQDEDVCKATTDEGGQACEWCAVSGVQLCITSEQAEIAEQVGGSCDAAVVATSVSELKDPYDTSCLLASLEQDESICEGTVDSDGGACEWCSMNGVDLCLNDEQAEIVEQVGGSCNTVA